MKKCLSIILVIALAATLFAGCNTKPSPSENIVDPTPTPSGPVVDTGRPDYTKDVIAFNLYNEGDYMTIWSDTSKAWMLENYKLKINASIPAVQEISLATESGRKTYNTAIANLFLLTEDSRPDYMPALLGSSVGTDACFKELGLDHLVDLNPYLGEGGILEDYIKWVWGGSDGTWSNELDYWNNAKKALEVDGKLYALPRREMMPVQNFLGYAEIMLEKVNVSWDQLPTTWDGFVTLLKKFKSLANDNIPMTMRDAQLENLMQFVASTYGLDFNMDFRWTQKNGEPLWTYYWEEYLQILTNIKELAAEGLVMTDASVGKGVVMNYDFDYSSRAYKNAKALSKVKAEQGYSIAAYATSADLALWASYGCNHVTEWKVSDKLVAQEGKNASLLGTSMFDAQTYGAGGYIAIGKRLGEEFTLRILDMLSFSASKEGYITYFFGREGSPFADDVKDAGNLVYDENGKLRIWNDDRFGFAENKDFWISKDSHASALEDYNFEMSNLSDGVNYAEEYGITDTGFWPARKNYVFGTMFQADVTSYPMELTAYWERESMSVDRSAINTVMSEVENNGSIIYYGMYMTTTERLGGTNGQTMQTKINDLQTIAKNFTVDFLKGDKTASDWDSYIKNLRDAGYNDVYEFYCNAAYAFSSTYREDVESQSDLNAKRQ